MSSMRTKLGAIAGAVSGMSGVALTAINSAIFFKIAQNELPEELFPFVGAAMVGASTAGLAVALLKEQAQEKFAKITKLGFRVLGLVPGILANVAIYHGIKPEVAKPATVFSIAVGAGGLLNVAEAALDATEKDENGERKGLSRARKVQVGLSAASSVMILATLLESGDSGAIFDTLTAGGEITKRQHNLAMSTAVLDGAGAVLAAAPLLSDAGKFIKHTYDKCKEERDAKNAFDVFAARSYGGSGQPARSTGKGGDLSARLLNGADDSSLDVQPDPMEHVDDDQLGGYLPPVDSIVTNGSRAVAAEPAVPAKKQSKSVATPGAGAGQTADVAIAVGGLSRSHSVQFAASQVDSKRSTSSRVAGQMRTPGRS